jgi:hypothetical protein
MTRYIAAALLTAAAFVVSGVHAGDPSPGWLTYAQWTSKGGRITMLNTSWVVPVRPF